MDPVSRSIAKWSALLAAGCILILLVGWHSRKADRIQTAWDESVARGKVEVERLKSEAGKVTVKVETEYVEVVKTIREKGDVVIREVPVFVPADDPGLSGGFRVYHDAAAAGAIPDAARIPDAAPVAADTAASTVAGNYFTCHETAARLTALQGWVAEQHRLNPGE